MPTRDRDGRLLCDFMMLLPGFARRPASDQQALLERLDARLRQHCPPVVFVDCNLKLGVLWVSLRAEPWGWCRVAETVRDVLPEARLVSPGGAAVAPRR